MAAIQPLTFAADTLKVAAGGSVDRHKVAQVSKIEFLWWESAGDDDSVLARWSADIALSGWLLAGRRC